jgi:hypothetical protein
VGKKNKPLERTENLMFVNFSIAPSLGHQSLYMVSGMPFLQYGIHGPISSPVYFVFGLL